MAVLTRTVKLFDSPRTQTFSFILPGVSSLNSSTEIVSRDFLYTGLKWRMSFTKHDRHLCPKLAMTSASPGLTCTLDFCFVLINRDSFTKNEMFEQKKHLFTAEETFAHDQFLTFDEMVSRQFTDQRGEFLFELTLRNPACYYEQATFLNAAHRRSQKPAGRNDSVEDVDYNRYDTAYFTFGNLEWTAVFCPNMDVTPTGQRRHMLQLIRVTKSEMLSRLKYRIVLAAPDCDVTQGRQIRQPEKDEIFDFSGNGEGWYFTQDYLNIAKDFKIVIRVHLVDIRFISMLELDPFNSTRKSCQCRDVDRQGWMLMSLADMEFLSFRLVYKDMRKLPENYARYVSWTLRILGQSTSKRTSQEVLGAPLEKYFSRHGVETEGYYMLSNIRANDLKLDNCIWVDEETRRITVHLEWIDSYLLLHSGYHQYDDIIKRHMAQMRREVQALQSENNQLEKELYKYQVSIANKCGNNVLQLDDQAPSSSPQHQPLNDALQSGTPKSKQAPQKKIQVEDKNPKRPSSRGLSPTLPQFPQAADKRHERLSPKHTGRDSAKTVQAPSPIELKSPSVCNSRSVSPRASYIERVLLDEDQNDPDLYPNFNRRSPSNHLLSPDSVHQGIHGDPNLTQSSYVGSRSRSGSMANGKSPRHSTRYARSDRDYSDGDHTSGHRRSRPGSATQEPIKSPSATDFMHADFYDT